MSHGAGVGRGPVSTTGQAPGTVTSAKRARDREVGEDAERLLELPEETPLAERDGAELDDAPPAEDVPELLGDRDEDPSIADDGEQDPQVRVAGFDPWVRLTIFRDPWGLAYHVEHPESADRSVEEALDLQDGHWSKLAETLISVQKDALSCSTPMEALDALRKEKKQENQRSEGQLSRDRHSVVGTPFGAVPLDFFFMGRRIAGQEDSLFSDLLRVGRRLVQTEVRPVPLAELRDLLPHLPEKGLDATRHHVAALVRVLERPDIIARHRQLWPLTSTDALFDDLGFAKGRTSGRLQPAAILAILGAFEIGNPVLVRSVPPRPPRVSGAA